MLCLVVCESIERDVTPTKSPQQSGPGLLVPSPEAPVIKEVSQEIIRVFVV